MARKGAEFIFRGVDQVSGEAGKVVKSLGKVNKRQKTVARELAGLKRIMTGVTAAFAAGSAALIKYTHAGDQIAKSARKIGVSAETYQSLGLAVRDAGGSTEGLYTGLRQLTRVIGETSTGMGRGIQAFEQLGISVRDSGGEVKSTDDLLIEINAAMANVGSEAEKANIANRLFGRGWTDLNVVMKEGATAITDARDRAVDLGAVVSEDLLTKAEQATSQWEKLGTTFEAVAIKAAASFGGESEALGAVQGFLSEVSKTLDETSDRGLNVFETMVEGIQYQFFRLIDELKLTEGLSALVEQDIIDAARLAKEVENAAGKVDTLGESYDRFKEKTGGEEAPMEGGEEGDSRLLSPEEANRWLEEILNDRTELLDDAYKDEEWALEQFDEMYAEMLANQQKELAAKQQANMQIVAGFGNLLSVMGQQSKTALAVSKAVRIAETVMSAIQATQAAYAHGMTVGGIGVAESLAARAKVVGALNVAAVTAVQLGSGSQVASYGGDGSAPRYEPIQQTTPNAPTPGIGTTEATERTVYMINLPPDTSPEPDAAARLIETLRAANERTGGVELQFGVQT